MNLSEEIVTAVQNYIVDVKTLDFPNAREQY
jgi:ketopantoate hydroxymethyltransferase